MTTSGTTRTPTYCADEKQTLHASLDRHRDAVLWKLEGLDDEQLRRPMTPTGTNLLGLVKHLASVEYGWFVETFGGRAEPLWFDPYDDLRITPEETTERITAFYGRARAAADAMITELPLDTQGRPAWRDITVSLRWTLVHMIEETARHAGHMDILRELIDGATGDHPPAGGTTG
ncbi:DinB family protein [Streptomyces sp. NPDC004232]|uniref:DinB family protein n=1 Tax=Streptomyces sp. NPDC004232 TaxID=3154454 RepID=UPI001D1FCE32|nr:DinB family protein [Streptomyces sp. tea 10]